MRSHLRTSIVILGWVLGGTAVRPCGLEVTNASTRPWYLKIVGGSKPAPALRFVRLVDAKASSGESKGPSVPRIPERATAKVAPGSGGPFSLEPKETWRIGFAEGETVLGHQLVEFRDHQSSTLLFIKMEHCQEWLLFGSLPKINITRIKFWPVSAHPNHYLKAMQTDESNKIVIIADAYPPAD